MKKAFLIAGIGIFVYGAWACKVRVVESSTVAASESELLQGDKFNCVNSPEVYPQISDLSLLPDQAAVRFELKDTTSNGGSFKFVYFAHGTKYYNPDNPTMQYYAMRLGDNLIDIEAKGTDVTKVYYQANEKRHAFNCSRAQK